MSGGGSMAANAADDQTLSDDDIAQIIKARQEATQAQGMNSSGAGPLASAVYRYAVPGVGPQQAQMLADQTADFGAAGLGSTMDAASIAQGLSPSDQAIGHYGGKALGFFGGLGSRLDSAMNDPKRRAALTMGLGLMAPSGKPQMGPQGRPAPEGPSHVSSPYEGAKALPVSGMGANGPRPGETWADYFRRKTIMGQ
jgi:hypothetical protein